MPEVTKNEDGTWHAPGAGDFPLKRDAQEALDIHQQELKAAKARPAPAPVVPSLEQASALTLADPATTRYARRSDPAPQGGPAGTHDAIGNLYDPAINPL